ncbi:CRISPR-associated endonuclease Cas3'' [Streptomyces sp. NPDC102381]|uniref:CRISPR-associated endonuclease Cas3'' n=1 Tax=Streptomyces sp. NPDC102381 TaxID=3366164 RepID=UPI003825749F
MGVVEDERRGALVLGLWGKYCPRHGVVYPLLFHMLDVAAVAGELWDRVLVAGQRQRIAGGLGLDERAARLLVMFIAGCHDIGKATRFQECESEAWARVNDALQNDTGDWRWLRHDRAGLYVLVELLAEAGYPQGGNYSSAVRLAQTAAAHHGRFLALDLAGAARPERVHRELGGRLWQEIRRRYVAQIRHLTGAHAAPQRVDAVAAMGISGVVMLADRLASQRRVWVPRAQMGAYGAADHFAWARWMASQVVEQSQLTRLDLPTIPFEQAHPGLEQPNALQASVMDQLPRLAGEKGPGILVVTDATGGGKTVTALEGARILNQFCHTRGVCYLLPTTATTDAAYDTLLGCVKAHAPVPLALTLVHNHSWLNRAYTDQALAPGEAPDCRDGDRTADLDEDEEWASLADDVEPPRRWVPDGWLRGWDRALLAQFTVATVDQALMTALPVRYNALRMLALTGRTVVIDEAHALDAFSRRILARLLHWLGAWRTPVIVLSATLPAHEARTLVHAYLTGAGHRERDLRERDYRVPYPGWLYADAATATGATTPAAAATAHAAAQHRMVEVTNVSARYRPLGDPARPFADDERLTVIAGQLADLVHGSGCALIRCPTMDDAQDTYRYLKQALPWRDPKSELLLVHARMPGHRREDMLRRLRQQLGPRGPRPKRLAVVTTSLLEVSLDIDADLVIADLTSMARLLQLVGRLGRFPHLQRPARLRRPRLVVVHPHERPAAPDRELALPATWNADHPFLLHATAALLHQRADRQPHLPDGVGELHLPDDVHELTDLVHGEQAASWASTGPGLAALYEQWQASQRADEHLSATQLIPAPARIASLAELSHPTLTSARAATRIGDRPRRAVACYRHPRGRTLDRDGHQPLPLGPHLSPDHIRSILEHSFPVPDAWVAHAPPGQHGIEAWMQHPLLADLVLLEHDPHQPQPVRFGRHHLLLDDELGLVHRESSQPH